MTATVISSANVTNRLASPPTYSSIAAEGSGRRKAYTGTMEVATTSTDEADDTIVLQQVRGSSRIVSIKLFCDDLDSGGTALAVDVGLYKDTSAAGTASTVVDADAYASATTALSTAITTGTEVSFEARDVAKMGQTVAVDGGEDEHNDMRYVALTVTTAATTSAAGTLSWIIEVIEP